MAPADPRSSALRTAGTALIALSACTGDPAPPAAPTPAPAATRTPPAPARPAASVPAGDGSTLHLVARRYGPLRIHRLTDHQLAVRGDLALALVGADGLLHRAPDDLKDLDLEDIEALGAISLFGGRWPDRTFIVGWHELPPTDGFPGVWRREWWRWTRVDNAALAGPVRVRWAYELAAPWAGDETVAVRRYTLEPQPGVDGEPPRRRARLPPLRAIVELVPAPGAAAAPPPAPAPAGDRLPSGPDAVPAPAGDGAVPVDTATPRPDPGATPTPPRSDTSTPLRADAGATPTRTDPAAPDATPTPLRTDALASAGATPTRTGPASPGAAPTPPRTDALAGRAPVPSTRSLPTTGLAAPSGARPPTGTLAAPAPVQRAADLIAIEPTGAGLLPVPGLVPAPPTDGPVPGPAELRPVPGDSPDPAPPPVPADRSAPALEFPRLPQGFVPVDLAATRGVVYLLAEDGEILSAAPRPRQPGRWKPLPAAGVPAPGPRDALRLASTGDGALYLLGCVDERAHLVRWDGAAWQPERLPSAACPASLARADDGEIWLATGMADGHTLWRRPAGGAWTPVPLPMVPWHELAWERWYPLYSQHEAHVAWAHDPAPRIAPPLVPELRATRVVAHGGAVWVEAYAVVARDRVPHLVFSTRPHPAALEFPPEEGLDAGDRGDREFDATCTTPFLYLRDLASGEHGAEVLPPLRDALARRRELADTILVEVVRADGRRQIGALWVNPDVMDDGFGPLGELGQAARAAQPHLTPTMLCLLPRVRFSVDVVASPAP
jgi:hypothetical protein